ncbi:MAG: PD40 domain-containing protein, partial [Anaerolineales bacterium]|nr:PD40 domain-containing protein [Anaerolineales bacterium]
MVPSKKHVPSHKQFVAVCALGLFILLLAGFNAANASLAPASSIELVSKSSSGTLGNAISASSDVSDDGIVVFASSASNLVTGDTNGLSDVFYRDTVLGTTKRISVSATGQQGNGGSTRPVISSDGRYIAFMSIASNLVAGDTNGSYDIFVYDRITEGIERVSVSSSGVQGDASSADPSISNDGRYVAFLSFATNFSANDPDFDVEDIYVHDRQTNQTQLVSVSSQGVKGNLRSYEPAISGNGQFVAFTSNANNLVANDTNGWWDVFVYNRNTGVTVRRSVDSGGVQSDRGGKTPSISNDGRYLAFVSTALIAGSIGENQVFLHDSSTNQTIWVSSGATKDSLDSQISDDGNYVVFESAAQLTNDPNYNSLFHIYRYSRLTQEIVLVSGLNGVFANNDAWYPALAADGSLVAFETLANNLVGGDNNNAQDIFLWRASFPPPTPTLNSISNADQNGDYTVSWSSSTGAVDYLLQEQLNNGSWSTLDTIVGTSYAASGRANGSWCYRVQARNNAGNSPWSNIQCTAVNAVFSISGRVTENGTGNPIVGVTITTNKGQTALTNSSGNYIISGLASDTYTVVASKSGYGFVPIAPSVTVPPSQTGIDFIGAGAADVYNTPFLTDVQLEDYDSMNVDQIRQFLASHNSYFRQSIQDYDGVIFDPAEAIASAASLYQINPKVLLATLEKENNGVTRTTRPSNSQMRFLMGCGVLPNTARQQLTCAAERFRS